jgi:nucleoid-associated protein YgaU
MPEPIVIIGSTARPGGPSGESADDATATKVVGTGVPPQESPKSSERTRSPLLPAFIRIASVLSVRAARAFWTLVKAALYVASRYPRHSLGAGASIVILGTVLSAQLRSGKGERPPVIASIPGDAAAPVAVSGANGSPAKTIDDNKGGAAKENGRGASGKDPIRASTDRSQTASSDTSSPSDKSSRDAAPAATALNDAASSPPSVAEGPTSREDRQPAPDTVASPGAVVELPKAEPTAAPEHNPAAATLLTQRPPEPAPSPSSSTIKENFGNADPVATAAAPPPVTTAEPSPPPARSGDPVSLPTHTDGPMQLAAALEPAGDPKQSNATSAPDPVRPEPTTRSPLLTGTAVPTDSKAEDDVEHALTHVPQKSAVEGKSVPTEIPAIPTTEPQSLKNAPLIAEGAHSTNQEIDKAASGTVGRAHPSEGVPVVPLPDQSIPVRSEPSSRARSGAGSSAPESEAADPGNQNAASQRLSAGPPSLSPVPSPDSRLETPVSSTQLPDTKSQAADSNPTQMTESHEPEKRILQNTLEDAQPEPRNLTGPSPDIRAKPSALEELANAGWVSVPNSGKMAIDASEEPDTRRRNSANGGSAEPIALRDVGAHTAKDVSFEQEASRIQTAQVGPRSGQSSNAGVSRAAQTRARPAAERVESVPHVVESGENFWTISRRYYASGRYYRALWKANADKHPEIDKLAVNDVIMVPAVEDLDPAYIDPPRTSAPAALGSATHSSNGRSRVDSTDSAESSVSSSSINHDEPVYTTRTNRGSADGVPVRRSSRFDPDLDLPAPEAVTRPDRGTDPVGHRSDVVQGDDTDNNEPEIRTAARPRSSGLAPLGRPVYKVRQYDTLRSIARDMLGDSHRSREILELNQELIDDPSHLIVGQVLELPEDARTTVRRSASR